MTSYTESNVKYIFRYWGVPKWTTEPKAMMVKDRVGKCYTNGAAVRTALGGGDHRIIGDLMLAALYETVSATLFAALLATTLTTPPNHSPLTTRVVRT